MPTFTDASLIAAGSGTLLWALLAKDASRGRRTAVGLIAFLAFEAAVFVRYTHVVVPWLRRAHGPRCVEVQPKHGPARDSRGGWLGRGVRGAGGAVRRSRVRRPFAVRSARLERSLLCAPRILSNQVGVVDASARLASP
jgi:hypothetical protein